MSSSAAAVFVTLAIVVDLAVRDGARGGGGAMAPASRAAVSRVRGAGGVALVSGVMSTTRAYEHGRLVGQQRPVAGEGVSLQLHC